MSIEQLAKTLCNSRWGAGAWEGSSEKGRINRSYWRRKAKKLLGE